MIHRYRVRPVKAVGLFLCVLAFYLAAHIPAFAQQAADAAVTGTLPDPIALIIGEKESRYTKQENNTPLEIRFCEEKTSKDYCVTPNRNLNRTGMQVTSGVALTPAIEGEWRWQSDYSLVFTPKSVWPAGQNYSVAFDATLFPPHVTLKNTGYAFSSEKLAGTVSSMTFFQDPNDLNRKLVSTLISFNYPVATESVEKALRFSMEELEGGKPVTSAQNLDFKAAWETDKRSVTVTTPIATLPDKERFMKIEILSTAAPLHGEGTLDTALGKPVERVLIPSIYSYVQITQLGGNVVKNKRFEPEQVLSIRFNAPTTTQELKAALTIKLLPKDKPAPVEGQSAKKDYAWSSPTEVPADLLKDAPAVPFTLSETAGEHSTVHTLVVAAEPGRWLHVTLKKGMKTYGGFILGKNYANTVQAPAFGKEAKIMPEGAVLSLSGEKRIALYSLGVGKLDVELGRVLPQNLNHFISQSYGNFESPDFNWNFNAENITERFNTEIPLTSASPSKPQFSSFDFSDYVKAKPVNRGLFLFKVQAKEKNKDGVETVVAEDGRFILITDLGFLVKTNIDGTRDVFVQSLEDGSPVSGARIDVLGKNGLPVATVQTNGDGRATLPNLKGFEREKQPVAFVVRKDRDLSFMPFGRYDRTVNYSRFETGGQSSSGEGLRAYMFSDRGIYRPGDTFNLGIIVKQGEWAESLEGLPLTLEIVNPRGQVVEKSAVKLNAEGFIEHSFKTRETSATGVYNANLYISDSTNGGEHIGGASVRVEEFLPDSMKITSRFNKEDPKGWIAPKDLEATVNLMNLYGTPAAGHRVGANVNLAPGAFTFADYKEYQFFDAGAGSQTFDLPLTDATTDESGNATFPIDLSSYADSTYRLTFYAEGYEKGSGRSVKTAKSLLVSPLAYVVGYKADGPLNYINQNSLRTLQLQALDSRLDKTEVKDLLQETYSISYIDSLVESGGGFSYQSVAKETILTSERITLPQAGLAKPLETANAGNYALVLKNAEGVIVTRIDYSVAGDASLVGATKKDNVIDVKLDKASYEPGEDISLSITSPYTGAGLITIETDKVHAHQWFTAATTSSVQRIAIPEGFAGKGYVNVQFVRARDSKEIYTTPLSVGVASFQANMDAMSTGVSVSAPEKTKPGENLVISYTAKKPGKIIIFAVDEGILQYARYKTPDPLTYLIGNRALQVETSQIMDLLMPEYSVMQGMSAFGGDAALNDGRNLNPFKRKTQPPVAFWSGLLDADGSVKSVTYKVPDYFNGTLRIMAVSVAPGAVGAAEQKTTVRADVIVTPNAPLFAAPGDEFEVTTRIANNIAGSGDKANFVVIAEPSAHLSIVNGGKQELLIAEGKEGAITVRVKASDMLGGASVKFTATHAKATASLDATLSVRPATPSMAQLVTGYMDKGEKRIALARKLYTEFAEGEASVSGMPLSLVPGLVRYLNTFPYGCTEQIVSQSFPSVALEGDKDFTGTFKETRQAVAGVMATLSERQNYSGGISLWWSGDTVSDFATVYAFHFMTLAKEKQLAVPVDMYGKTLEYVRQTVNRSVVSLEQARLNAYGIYLLTRNGEVTSNYLPFLIQYLDANHKDVWKHDTAALYIAATFKLMQMEPEALALIDSFTLDNPTYWQSAMADNDPFYNDLIRHSVYLSILSDHFPAKLAGMDKKALFRIANFVGEGSYNTVASSYAVMGLASYAKASAGAQLENVTLAGEKDGVIMKQMLTLAGDKVKRAAFDAQLDAVILNSPDAGTFYQLSTVGYDRTLPGAAQHDGIEVTHAYLNEQGEPVTSVQIGDTVTVQLTLRSYNETSVPNIAVVDLLPGGFDLVPTSLPQSQPAAEGEAQESEAMTEPTHEAGVVPGDTVLPSWIPDAVDGREDRMILYGTLDAAPSVFTYQIKAVNAGSFVTPPSFAESMYQRAVKSRGVAGSITVAPDAK